jgi:uncharacterized membrane protein
MQDSDLDDLFAAARAAAPPPSSALLARIEADGLRLQPGPAPRPVRPPDGLRGLFGRMVLAVGGLGGATGLAAATLAGLWIGVAQPQGLSPLTEGLTAGLGVTAALDSVELIPALDPFAAEGRAMTGSDQPPPRAPGRGIRIALAVSLALNLAVAGVVAGTFLGGGGRSSNPTVRDIGFGPFTAALSPQDREALGRAFREQAPDMRAMRREMRGELDRLLQALRADPFDEAALLEAIAAQDARGRARLELGQRLLAERLIAMTPPERGAFADRLERVMDRGRNPRRGAGDRD